MSNSRVVTFTPVVAQVLLEWANVGQLWRMWVVQSALGQNIWSWISVHVALWLWLNFYRIALPPSHGRTLALGSTAIGIVFNGAVILTVAYFRYIVGNS